jgi:putative Holliday junction resolvase
MTSGGAAGRVMAIDYGTRRVGVAVSDPLRILASGRGTLANSPLLLDELRAIVDTEEISLIIVGMPYAPDGGKGTKGAEVEEFVGRLRGAVRIPVDTWDESFTSVNAHRAFIESGMKKKQRQEKGRVDEMAARLLLQEYLENTHHR